MDALERCRVDVAWLAGNSLWSLRRALTRAAPREPRGVYRDFLRFNLLGRRDGFGPGAPAAEERGGPRRAA